MDFLDEIQTYVEPNVVDGVDTSKHNKGDEVHLMNLTEDDNGELVQAPWAGGQDIGDMTPDQLQEHMEAAGVKDVDVSEVIKMMQDPNMNLSFMQSGKPRRPKISAKKKKSKRNIVKASRKNNRKKK